MIECKELFLTCLNEYQHADTCGYWYTVTSHGMQAHTAFRSKQALLDWLNNTGLKLEKALPENKGEHQAQHLKGSYFDDMTSDQIRFNVVRSIKTIKHLSNAQYTLAKISEQCGKRVITYLNPNCDRIIYDYKAAQKELHQQF